MKRLRGPALLHACLAIGWALMFVPTVLWWSESILWVGTMSIYAIVVGHWSAVEAARPNDDS